MLSGCTHLHQVQVGDMDQTHGKGHRFDIKTSETGINISEAATIAKAVSKNKTVHQASNAVSDAWKFITYGPKTGEVTFSDTYSDSLPSLVDGSCGPGHLVGFTTMRETNKYPVISGEIVRLVGYCR